MKVLKICEIDSNWGHGKREKTTEKVTEFKESKRPRSLLFDGYL